MSGWGSPTLQDEVVQVETIEHLEAQQLATG